MDAQPDESTRDRLGGDGGEIMRTEAGVATMDLLDGFGGTTPSRYPREEFYAKPPQRVAAAPVVV